MKDIKDVEIGNVIRLKKSHPCGSFDWEVLRVGMDFRLKCIGCGHHVMISRSKIEKSIKEIKNK